jgi:hypothetical protein
MTNIELIRQLIQLPPNNEVRIAVDYLDARLIFDVQLETNDIVYIHTDYKHHRIIDFCNRVACAYHAAIKYLEHEDWVVERAIEYFRRSE